MIYYDKIDFSKDLQFAITGYLIMDLNIKILFVMIS